MKKELQDKTEVNNFMINKDFMIKQEIELHDKARKRTLW